MQNNQKYNAEINFWIEEIKNYIKWYQGDIKEHYLTSSPTDEEKVVTSNLKDSAILTWFQKHQKTKYLFDLKLTEDDFSGLKILDLGSGPFPNALGLKHINKLYALDPLLPDYLKAGFPIHYYEKTSYIAAFAENIPIEDDFFDVVLSLNALDHFDDLNKTSAEINRVLKKDGFFIAHVHYHKSSITEPLEINDELFKQTFSWCHNLKKIYEKKEKFGSLCNDDESYVLWSNFH